MSDNVYENPNQNPEYANKWRYDNLIDYKKLIFDRITDLLISKFLELKESLDITGIESLQKTYKDGMLVSGKEKDGMLVIYENDLDVQSKKTDKKLEDALIKWLDFEEPTNLDLIIESDPSNLVFKVSDRTFDINQQMGTLGLDGASIKNIVSQFIGVNQLKTKIDRKKLKEFVDTEFTELTPVTFTHLLERFNALKIQIPFYRYRTDDFFIEYNEKNVPIGYRIEKFFEEFDNIKDQIPAGEIKTISSVNMNSEEDLFGYGSMTYLMKESRLVIDDGNIPEWSTEQVSGFVGRINNLNVQITAVNTELNSAKDTNDRMNKLLEEYGVFDLQQAIQDGDLISADLRVEVENLTTEVALVIQEKTTIEFWGHGLLIDNGELEAQAVQLNELISIKDSQNNTLTWEKGNLQDEKTILESNINLLTNERNSLSTSKDNLTAELGLKNANITQLNSNLSLLESDKSTLQTTVNNLQSDKSTLSTELSGLESTKSTLQTSISGLQATNATLNASVSTLTGEKSTLSTTVNSLQSQNSALEVSVSGLQVTNATLDASVSELTAEKSTLSATVNSLQTQNAALQTSTSGLQATNATLTASVSELTAEKSTLSTTVNSLQTQNSALEVTVSGVQSDKASLTSQVADLQSQVQTLSAENAQLSVAVADASGQVQVQYATINSLNAQIAQYESTADLDYNQDGGLNILDVTGWINAGNVDKADRVLQEMGFPAVKRGCKDPHASNYDPEAQYDDGSCGQSMDYNQDGGLNVLDIVGWANSGNPEMAQITANRVMGQRKGGKLQKGGRTKPVIKRKK